MPGSERLTWGCKVVVAVCIAAKVRTTEKVCAYFDSGLAGAAVSAFQGAGQ
jgi:hypothetical protein